MRSPSNSALVKIGVNAILALILAPAIVLGQANSEKKVDKAPAAQANDTSNPLANDDPFVGEFGNEEMLITLRLTVDGYTGEIRRGGRDYPLKAAIDKDKLAGRFTHEQSEYPFSALLESGALKLTTGNKVYTLRRKGGPPSTALPVPVAPAPIPSPKPPTPTPPPDPQPVPPPKPEPVKPVLSGPLPQHLGYAQLTAAKLSDFPWSKFPAGAYIVLDESVGSTATVPLTARRKLVHTGFVDGRPRLRNHDWTGKEFDAAGVSVAPAPTEDLSRIGDLGLTKGTESAETLTVQGETLRCEKTSYTGESKVKDVIVKMTVEVWRCREVDLSPLVVELPHARVLMEPDFVRCRFSIDIRGVLVVIDHRLESIAVEAKVGERSVRCAVVRNSTTVDRGNGKEESSAEYWLSAEVPGGIAKSVQALRVGERSRTATVTVLDFSNVAVK